jgi:hypothetical protein
VEEKNGAGRGKLNLNSLQKQQWKCRIDSLAYESLQLPMNI